MEEWGRPYWRHNCLSFQNHDLEEGEEDEKIFQAWEARMLSPPLSLHSCPNRDVLDVGDSPSYVPDHLGVEVGQDVVIQSLHQLTPHCPDVELGGRVPRVQVDQDLIHVGKHA